MDIAPVTLEGRHVRLEPLGVEHLHNARITPEGEVRDVVWYSLIDPEWPAARARLLALMDR